MTSISTKYLLENAEVTKNKNDQSNPKNGGQTPKPPMPLAARHWFQRVQNPDPNKIHSASKSCSKPKPSTKRVVKFTKSTHMINGVLLLGFQCPNAQTLSYMTHRALKARMNYCINQNPSVDSVDCLLDGESLFVSDWFLSFTFFCKFSCYPWLVDDVGSITSPVWIVVHCVRVSQPSRLWARVPQPFLLPCFRGPLCGHCWQVLVWARHIMESQTRMMSHQSFEEIPPRECLLLVGKSCTEPMALNVHAVSYLKSSFTGCLGKMESSICRPGTDML